MKTTVGILTHDPDSPAPTLLAGVPRIGVSHKLHGYR